MTALLIGLIVVGVLLMIGGLFLKPLWRVAVRPFYRHPEAQEPSRLGWGARSAVMIVAGAIVIVASAGMLIGTAPTQPTPSEVASRSCADLVDEVGSPSSSAAADEAITAAAEGAGFAVEREESSSDSVAELPGGDQTITVSVTTWTVRSPDAAIATFTWTSADSVPGRFTAAPCS